MCVWFPLYCKWFCIFLLHKCKETISNMSPVALKAVIIMKIRCNQVACPVTSNSQVITWFVVGQVNRFVQKSIPVEVFTTTCKSSSHTCINAPAHRRKKRSKLMHTASALAITIIPGIVVSGIKSVLAPFGATLKSWFHVHSKKINRWWSPLHLPAFHLWLNYIRHVHISVRPIS